MSIERFDSKNIRTFREEATEALREVALKHGVDLVPTKGTYCDEYYEVAFKFQVVDKSGAPKEFLAWARRWELPMGCYHQQFSLWGQTFRLVNIKPRNRKYPMIGEELDADGNPTGKLFKFPRTQVVNALRGLSS